MVSSVVVAACAWVVVVLWLLLLRVVAVPTVLIVIRGSLSIWACECVVVWLTLMATLLVVFRVVVRHFEERLSGRGEESTPRSRARRDVFD